MSGKPQLPLETREQDVPTALDRQYVGITLYRPLTLPYQGNGTLGRIALLLQEISLQILVERCGGFVAMATNGRL